MPRNRLKHERPGVTYACPACDNASLYRRTGDNVQDHPDRPFKCEGCGVALFYVIIRAKKNGQGRAELPKQRTLGYENGPRQRSDRDLEAMAPEDAGLCPIGVRGGAD